MAGLLIIGAGGYGKVVADTAMDIGYWDKIAFLDDCYPQITSVLDFPILDKVDQIMSYHDTYNDLVVAVLANELRVALIRRFIECSFCLPTIVHPKAFVSNFSKIGQGSVVFAQAVINACTIVGIGGIIHTGATVDHDCILGCGVHVSPGVHIAGQVQVGDYTWLGMGSSIIQQRSISHNVMIGAGSVIIKDIPSYTTVMGMPGKEVKK